VTWIFVQQRHKQWLSEIDCYANEHVNKLLVGNKVDLISWPLTDKWARWRFPATDVWFELPQLFQAALLHRRAHLPWREGQQSSPAMSTSVACGSQACTQTRLQSTAISGEAAHKTHKDTGDNFVTVC
jgi:hypothetical protein